MDEQNPPTTIENNSSASSSTNDSSQLQQDPVLPVTDGVPIDERLAMLQEFYQRRHAELLAQFQHTQTLAQQDYLLNLQLLQSALPAAAAMVVLQQQQQQQTPALSQQQQQSSTDLSNDELDVKTDRQKFVRPLLLLLPQQHNNNNHQKFILNNSQLPVILSRWQ
uniref:Uncharacterized protein n=1 Tax=Meloidogyne enterolobii TaxID=390850 RepID=A0A6V7U019_MELEN|nr:unnamed protein product [Meloidogyne enterolobii]